MLGIIVGAAITVGVAYVHDSGLPAQSAQRYVNWQAVDEGWRELSARVRTGWENLSATVDRRLKSSRLHASDWV
ncbi:MAG: hypothetical protein IT514_15620 [Burkholderiales bacterium]|nr:hypothetical protein [Burkholderiales bacterium]